MAPLQAALGASRVGSCIGGAKAAAATPRANIVVAPPPLGRRATNAVAASASASSSSQHPSETRPTRPEHGGRQLDSAGSSSEVRRRTRRGGRGSTGGRNDGAAVASASASASASAPSFETLDESSISSFSSSASGDASSSPSASLSDPEERRPALSAPATSSSSNGTGESKSYAPRQQGPRGNFDKANNKRTPSSSPSSSASSSSSARNNNTSTRARQRGSGEPIPMDKFARGELVVGKVTSVSPAGARVALLGYKPRVIAFCPAKEMGPPRCVVASAASQAAAAAALSLKLEKKKKNKGREEEEGAKEEGEEGEEEASPSSSSGDGEPAASAAASKEESEEEAAARKLIKAAKLAVSAQPVPSEHMQYGDVRQFVIMYTPKAATYGGVGPAVSARRADEQIMWRRAEAIAAVCKDDTPPPPPASSKGNNGNSGNGKASSSSGNGGDDSLAWDEEEAAPEASTSAAAAEADAEAEEAEAGAEATAAEGGKAGEEEEASVAAEEEEVAIDEAYLGPDSVVVTITGCNDGGLLTSLAGLPAFIPFSQVDAPSLGLSVPAGGDPAASTAKGYSPGGGPNSNSNSKRAWLTAATAAPAVGRQVRAVPTEVDAGAERIVLSVRAAAELSARQQLRVGALIWGTVRKAASYGLFVGIDGTRESALLHATNISRGARLPESPLEVLPLGSRVRALVVGMDEGGRRLSLSTAEIEENDGDMLVDPDKVFAGAEEQALYFRRHLEALAAQEAAGGGGGGGGYGGGGGSYGERRNNNYNKKGNGNRGYNNNNNRRNYDDDDGNREWSSG